jgi:hypothetical protein
LRRIAASSTDPVVGASTWASGNQTWNGNTGILAANATKNASQINTSRSGLDVDPARITKMASESQIRPIERPSKPSRIVNHEKSTDVRIKTSDVPWNIKPPAKR